MILIKFQDLTANQYPVQNVPIRMWQLVLKEKLTVIWTSCKSFCIIGKYCA